MASMVESRGVAGSVPGVPGPEQERLSASQARQIDAAQRRIAEAKKRVDDAEIAWAKFARKFRLQRDGVT